MKSRTLERIWIAIAAVGIGISLFINNSNHLVESNSNKISSAIIKK